MTRLDIITGFLGAGKTTFVNRYVQACLQKGERVAVLVNDFAANPIDDSLIISENKRKLSDGCVCCTLKYEFLREVADIVAGMNPDRIIFEPSGIFMLTDNLNRLREIDGLTVNSITCIVDGLNYYAQKADFSAFLDNQIANATKIIISKPEISNIAGSVVEDIKYMYGTEDKGIPITCKPYDDFGDGDFDLSRGRLVSKINVKNAHAAPLCFEALLTRKFSPFLLKQLVKNFKANRYGTVIRAKGILEKTGGGYALINVIANNADVSDLPFTDEIPRIAVMGEYLAAALLRADFF